MFFGLTMEKLLLVIMLAALLLGPERLPRYAESLRTMVRKGRAMMKTVSERAKDELGPEFEDVDWQKLDPRQYDPRRIIRSALLDDPTPARTVAPSVASPNSTQEVAIPRKTQLDPLSISSSMAPAGHAEDLSSSGPVDPRRQGADRDLREA